MQQSSSEQTKQLMLHLKAYLKLKQPKPSHARNYYIQFNNLSLKAEALSTL